MIIANNFLILEYANKYGISAYEPYLGIDNVITRRLISIIWKYNLTRLKELFRNRKVLIDKSNCIIVFDSMMDKEYLNWIKVRNPEKKLIFWYWNPIRNTIDVKDIPSGYEIWTYSINEANKEDIYFHEQFYFETKNAQNSNLNNGNVFYIGKDKGRANAIREIEDRLNRNGVKTEFIYVSDKRTLSQYIKKNKQGRPLPYNEVLEKTSACSIVFDYCLNPNDGLSLRPLEAYYYNKKLITNNTSIYKSVIYDPNWVFVIGSDSDNQLIEFCNKPVEMNEKWKTRDLSFSTWYADLVGDRK